MILIERRDLSKDYANGQLTLTNDSGMDWRGHPLVLTKTQFQSIENINRVMLVLTQQSQSPSAQGGVQPEQDSILRVLDAQHAKDLTKYKIQIVTASRNDLKEIQAFLNKHRNLHHKVGAGSAAGGAAVGAGVGAAIGIFAGPIGIAIGAGIGTVVGSIAGGITGHVATKKIVHSVAEAKGRVHRFSALKMIDTGEISRLEDVRKVIDQAARPIFLELQTLIMQNEIDHDRLQELQQLIDVRAALFPNTPLLIDQNNVNQFLLNHQQGE